MIVIHTRAEGDRPVDPDRNPAAGFSCLLGLDERVFEPGLALDAEIHQHIEILTYIVSGMLRQADDDGTQSTLLGGEVQVIRAGTGMSRRLSNPSHSDALHVLQARIASGQPALPAHCKQRYFSDDDKLDKLCLVAAPDGASQSLRLDADVRIYASVLSPGEPLLYHRRDNRRVWIQVAAGRLACNGTALGPGDAAAVEGLEDRELSLLGQELAEFLLLDLP